MTSLTGAERGGGHGLLPPPPPDPGLVNQRRRQLHVSVVNKIGTACMRQVLELKFSQIVGLLNTVRRPFHVKKSHELIKMPTDGVSMKLVRKLHNLPRVIQPLAANVDKPVTVAYIGLGLDCKR